MQEIRVIRLDSKEGGRDYVGVMHGRVYMYARKHNLEEAKRYVIYASKQNVRLLIFPYMQPHGPIIDENASRKTIRKNALTIMSPFFSQLSVVSRNHGLDLLIPGFIEKAGSKLYVTGTAIPGSIGEPISKARKLILSEPEVRAGISPGKRLGLIRLYNLGIGVFFDDEIRYPELSRALLLLGAGFLVYSMAPGSVVRNYTSLLKAHAFMLDTWIIHPGGLVYNIDSLVYHTPTIIASNEGEIELYYSEREPALVILPLQKITRRHRFDGKLLFLLRYYNKLISSSRKKNAETGEQ